MSVQVIVIHILGDVPSPPLLGLLQEHVQNWRWFHFSSKQLLSWLHCHAGCVHAYLFRFTEMHTASSSVYTLRMGWIVLHKDLVWRLTGRAGHDSASVKLPA